MTEKIKFTREHFIEFCKAFDEANCFDFDEKSVEEIGPDTYRYCSIYRDKDNYKSSVEFRLENGIVSWDVEYGWEDAYEEIQDIYRLIVRKFFGSEYGKLSPRDLEIVRKAHKLLKSVVTGDDDDRARIDDALHFVECLLMEYGGVSCAG
ncbi:MAG: hypothetical protein BLM47_13770 [Candidatus Reconcilbacillus cellulovorans]|uniref:Uncharacterized protein n=1 Tax=Candidatus Reconcilbacillus cellulovorans TaxID=1906605 RepID=A0A2A6DXJ7_9BACL|nr:MAG: hypothetical protein BLM47_13770 [Candidatus Reconcilbacillus cellulovorans]